MQALRLLGAQWGDYKKKARVTSNMQALALHDTLRQLHELRVRCAALRHSAELAEWAAAQTPRMEFDGQALVVSLTHMSMRLTATECCWYLGDRPDDYAINTRHVDPSAWRCFTNAVNTRLVHRELCLHGESLLDLRIDASTLRVSFWTPRNNCYTCQQCSVVFIDALRQPVLAFARAVGALE